MNLCYSHIDMPFNLCGVSDRCGCKSHRRYIYIVYMRTSNRRPKSVIERFDGKIRANGTTGFHSIGIFRLNLWWRCVLHTTSLVAVWLPATREDLDALVNNYLLGILSVWAMKNLSSDLSKVRGLEFTLNSSFSPKLSVHIILLTNWYSRYSFCAKANKKTIAFLRNLHKWDSVL